MRGIVPGGVAKDVIFRRRAPLQILLWVCGQEKRAVLKDGLARNNNAWGVDKR